MNTITSTRTAVTRIILRIAQNNPLRNVQKARFPPQRCLSHLAAVRPQLQSQGVVSWQRRDLATGSKTGDKVPVSPHITFYTIYGRPIAKVFLIAMGTYQALYWLWLKGEAMEEQKGMQEEIERVEKELEQVRPKTT